MSTQVLQVVVNAQNRSKEVLDEVRRQTQQVAAAQKEFSEAAAIGKRLSEQFGDALRDQATVEKIVTDEARRLSAAMRDGAEAVKTIGSASKETHSRLDEIGHAFATGLGLGAFLTVAGAVEKSLHAIKELVAESIKGTLEYAERMEIAALKTGLNTDAAQKFSVAANLTRSSLEAVTSAVAMMERNVADGVPKAVAAMEKLGLSADIFKDPEQAVLAISKALQTIPEPAERASIAMGLLGRGGASALPVLLQDLEALGDRAQRLGIIMGEEDVRAAAALNQESELLHETWAGLIRNFGLVFDTSGEVGSGLKNLTDTVGDLSQAFKEARPFLQDYYGLLARIAGLTQLGQGLEILRQFRNNLKEIFDQQDPLHATARLVTPDQNYFKETLAEQRAYLTAVMENQRIEEAEGRKHAAELKKIDDERLRALQRSQAQLKKDGDAFEKSWREQQKREIESHKAYVAQIIYDEKQHAEMMQVQSDLMTEIIVKAIREERGERRKAVDELEKDARVWQTYGDAVAIAGRALGGILGDAVGGAAGIFEGLSAHTRQSADNLKNHAEKSELAAQMAMKVAIAVDAVSQAFERGVAKADKWKGALSGAIGGAAAGAQIGGGWGALAGFFAGGVAGYLGGKAGQKKQLQDLRAEFLALIAQAEKAGAVLKYVFDPKTPQQFKEAIDEITRVLNVQAQAQQALQEAVDRYHFSIEELGPAFAAQQLDQKAAEIYQDWQLLTAAGIDHAAMLRELGPGVSALVDQYARAGAEIPASLRPVIDELFKQHKLLHENGDEFTQAEYDALTYGSTTTQMFQDLITKLNEFVDAIKGIVFPDKTQNVYERYHRDPNNPNNGNQPPGPGFNYDGTVDHDGDPSTGNGMAYGGYVPYRAGGTPAILGERASSGGEWALPNDMLGALAAEIVSAGGMAGGNAAPIHVHVTIGGERLDAVLARRKRGGYDAVVNN
jgi:hypothetical protein